MSLSYGSQVYNSHNLNGGRYSDSKTGNDGYAYGRGINKRSAHDFTPPSGRWPANLLLDEEAAQALDEQSGELKTGDIRPYKQANCDSYSGSMPEYRLVNHKGDSGGASRFFYVAKASKRERGEGNNHPTVKPLKLIEYLVRLITPPNGIVLDPFIGSGTTALACISEGVDCIGFEQDKNYCDIAEKRIAGLIPKTLFNQLNHIEQTR